MKSGLLIIVEGPDGVGKSTFCRLLSEDLRAEGLDVVELREPVDRACISAEDPIRAFAEDRAYQMQDKTLPAVARGSVVVQDRSYYSSIVYQGLGDSEDMFRVYQANLERGVQSMMFGLLQAERVLHIVLLPQETFREEPKDEIDANLALQEIVRAGYETLVSDGFRCADVGTLRKIPAPCLVYRENMADDFWKSARVSTVRRALAQMTPLG